MTYNTGTKLLFAIWLALLLCGSSGCATSGGVGVSSYDVLPASRVHVMNPLPFGYYPTQWHPWPQMAAAPPSGPVSRLGDIIISDSGSDLPQFLPPAPVPNKPLVLPGPGRSDWELLPVPEAETTEDQEEAGPSPETEITPAPDSSHEKPVPPAPLPDDLLPPSPKKSVPIEKDAELPPEVPGEVPLKEKDLPPEPPAPGNLKPNPQASILPSATPTFAPPSAVVWVSSEDSDQVDDF